MLIGVDMLGMQSSDSRGRGIGRYCHHFLRAFAPLAAERGIDLLAYVHDQLPAPPADVLSQMTSRVLPRTSDTDQSSTPTLRRVLLRNSDAIDAILWPSPLEPCNGFQAAPRYPGGPRSFAVLYDLIPLRWPERYLNCKATHKKYLNGIRILRRYDRLFAISEATRREAMDLLGEQTDRIVTIGCASDPEFFTPGPEPERSVPDEPSLLQRIGVMHPFLFNVGGEDDRKNVWGLLDAFARLPREVQAKFQLVISCSYSKQYSQLITEYAKDRRINHSLVLTNKVDDDTLRQLYRECHAFVFPSIQEGFGLPILEAMHCGAAVVAANNSSQPEVVGEAGLLYPTDDPSELARQILRLVNDPDLAQRMRSASLRQAQSFSWTDTATRALEEIVRVTQQGTRLERTAQARRTRPTARPRIAMFSPLPPKPSGISDYTARLAPVLESDYAVDLYHDHDYLPFLDLQSNSLRCFDHRLFERNARVIPYDNVIYQMGNSSFHHFIYQQMLHLSGVVVLHDFSLSGYQIHASGVAASRDRLENLYRGYRRATKDPALPDWESLEKDPRGVERAFRELGIFLNHEVFQSAQAVIVHSDWCRQQAARLFPEYASKVTVANFGAEVVGYSSESRAGLREKYGIEPDRLVFASVGILSTTKMNVESLHAFARVVERFPDALFLMIGPEYDGGETRRTVEELGLRERVRFFGQQPADILPDFAAVTDVGVCLRRPPTNGETSAALIDLLRVGVPTLVTEVGSFAEYPDDVVRKISPRDSGDQLVQEMLNLASNVDARLALGRRAYEHMIHHHSWRQLADHYRAVIEGLDRNRRASVARRSETSVAC